MIFSKQVIFSMLLAVFFVGSAKAMLGITEMGARLGAKTGTVIGGVVGRCAGFLIGIPAECGKFCCNKVFPIIRKHPGSATICLAGVVAGVVAYYALRSRRAAVQRYDNVIDFASQDAVSIQQESQQIDVH